MTITRDVGTTLIRMSSMYAAITGVSGFVPPDTLTNKDLEQMVDTNDEWITTRTGIRERRILKNMTASDMGVRIMDGLMEQTGLRPEEIDMVICATITGDTIMPDTANTICHKISATNAFGYDIGAACSGFLFALVTGSKFIETGTYKKVVVIGMDVMSAIIDYTDRSTCIIFGDGGGAVLLEPNTEGVGIKDAVLGGDGSGRPYLYIKAGGSQYPASQETVAAHEHYVVQDGRPVFKMAVKGMTSSVTEVLERNGLTTADVDWMVPHQANIRIIKAVAEALDFPLERTMQVIGEYGNTTAGTLPLCLWKYAPQLKKGDTLVLTAFGGGFTWGACLLTWALDGE